MPDLSKRIFGSSIDAKIQLKLMNVDCVECLSIQDRVGVVTRKNIVRY